MKKILVSLMLLVMTALSAHAQFEKEERRERDLENKK